MSIEPGISPPSCTTGAAGNPPSTLPDSAISNCFPGLEFDFRNLWRGSSRTSRSTRRRLRGPTEARCPGLEGPSCFPWRASPTCSGCAAPPPPRRTQLRGIVWLEWSNFLADVLATRSASWCRRVLRQHLRDSETVELRPADLRPQRGHRRAGRCHRRGGSRAGRADQSRARPGRTTTANAAATTGLPAGPTTSTSNRRLPRRIATTGWRAAGCPSARSRTNPTTRVSSTTRTSSELAGSSWFIVEGRDL